ncbi:MAG TPA: hypothetical protein PK668_18450 [Myxococcota bacterium]|nr:hypothetical protein [Myxococcota bacterium]HRY95946.1 hypothetical protein [Myxococcota bacterium]
MFRATLGLVCWLLLSWPALAGQASSPRLPASGSALPLEGTCELAVAADGIRLAGKPVVPLADWKPASEPGLWSGSMLLAPLHEALSSLQTERKKKGEQGALCLAIDRDTPYGLLTRVLYTAGQAEWVRLVFAVRAADGQARALPLELPRLAAAASSDDPGVRLGQPGDAPEPLNLTVAVMKRGLLVFGAGGRLEPETEADGKTGDPAAPTLGLLDQPGCKQAPTPTAACLPLARLGKKLAEIKRTFPEERRVIVVAMPELRFGDLVALLDALRGSPEKPLFPDLLLSAGIQ